MLQKLIFGQYFQNKSRCAAATLVKQADSSVYRGCFGMILRASQQSARAYRNILRYSLGLPPWHAGHVEITGEKNGRGTVVEASTDLSSFS